MTPKPQPRLHPELSISDQTQVRSGEYVAPAGDIVAGERVFCLDISPTMVFRRVYGFIESDMSDPSADFIVQSELLFIKGGAVVSEPIPIVIGLEDNPASSILKQSRVSIFTGTNVPGPGTIRVTLSNKFVSTVVFLNPCLLKMDADKMFLNIKRVAASNGAVNKYRVFLCVISSPTPGL
jgi:hypothetical protein